MHAVYDAAGNPRFVDRGFDAVLNAATPNAGYYYGGLSMTYNGAGQLSSAAADISDPAHPATLLQNVTYTPTGQEQTAELSSQYGQVSQYDNRSRRTSRYSANLNGQVVIGDSWSYDKVSNVTSAADSLQGSFNYTYDTLNRVTQATFGGITMNYGYDPWGNQTSHTVTQGSSYQWSFMPTSQNRATVTGSAYDAAGNMLADGTHQYTYNAEGQVAAVTDQGVSYVYDAEGKRIATYNGGTGAAHETAEYLNDMAGNLVVTLNPNHTMVRGILRDNLETHRGDYVGGPQGGAGSSEFRLVNQVGTLVANASSEGNFVEGCLSGPFGDGQLCTSDYNYTETHFTDKLRDKESNNDYFGARYFNSTLGRFTSPDPSGLGYADPSNPQSLNAYSYAQNNPLSNTEPTGLDCAYLNNAGTGIESSDFDSSIGECGSTGGYYVSGAVNTLNVGSNGSLNFGYQGVAADGNYTTTTYNSYLGPNTDNSLSSAYGAAGGLLSDFLTGGGATVRNYDLSTVEGRNLLQSKGIQQLNAKIKAGCAAGQQSGGVSLRSAQALANIPFDAAKAFMT